MAKVKEPAPSLILAVIVADKHKQRFADQEQYFNVLLLAQKELP